MTAELSEDLPDGQFIEWCYLFVIIVMENSEIPSRKPCRSERSAEKAVA